MKTGIELITDERTEQIEKHHRSIEYDVNSNHDGQLRKGAIALVGWDKSSDILMMPHDWDKKIVRKMCMKSYKERLIIMGALIAAEIDRLQNG